MLAMEAMMPSEIANRPRQLGWVGMDGVIKKLPRVNRDRTKQVKLQTHGTELLVD
jgi:hypothetical protein